jgi:proline iminopeptidase
MRTEVSLSILVGCCSCVAGPTDLVPATVDEDAALPAVTLNGSKFHLERSGATAGTPIIFLAGGPGNDPLYLSRLAGPCGGAALGVTHPLLFWDQRGAGLSRRHATSDLTYERFAEDLDALVEWVAPGDGKVILLGHSWGGTYAAAFINRHPEKVAGLVLLEPGELSQAIDDQTPSNIELDFTKEWLSDFAWGQQVITNDGHAQLDFYALVAARHVQPNRKDREASPTLRLGGAVIRSSFLGTFYPPNYDFTANLASFPTEVLIVAGDQEGGDLGAELQRTYHVPLFQHATLEVVPGASHTDVAWADACTTVEFIRQYLARVERGGRS